MFIKAIVWNQQTHQLIIMPIPYGLLTWHAKPIAIQKSSNIDELWNDKDYDDMFVCLCVY